MMMSAHHPHYPHRRHHDRNFKFEIAPQHHWGPLEMVWIPPGMWRVVPRGLTVTPREDDGGHDECDDDHPKYT